MQIIRGGLNLLATNPFFTKGNPLMALRTFVAATVAATFAVAATATGVLATASPAFARLAAPLLPTALVEDVKSAAGEIEFMDYVGVGQVIRLARHDVLVLSYLKSCAHEIITGNADGGSVTVGLEASEVQGVQIVRTKVACDGGKIRLSSQQASKSAASTFRVQSAEMEPTLFALTPIVKLPKTLPSTDRTLVIARSDRPGERHALAIDDASAARPLTPPRPRRLPPALITARTNGSWVSWKASPSARMAS
jgi:hypothetical protein